MTNALTAIHRVVSMLAGEEKITLFTSAGSIVDLKHNENYDTAEIVKYLRANLNGTNEVALDLAQYTKAPVMPAIAQTLVDGGIEVTQIIDGKEVQGIFYPKKATTVVAIKDEVVEIPGLDNLMRHAKRAKEYGSEAIKAFLNRMLPVLKTRQHSAEDLMNFIGNSEMPLTLDGRVIAYKRLNKGVGTNFQGYWVDPYSKTVKQKVGTIVEMPEVDVDPSRYNSCSNGLHVANRTYFNNGNFSGDDTFVVLVNPEDFIAVPKGEHGKARVTRYQIIGMLTSNAHAEISQGYVKDNDSLKRLVANAIEGRIVPATEIAYVSKKGYLRTEAIVSTGTKKAGGPSEVSLAAARSLDADPQEAMIPTSQATDKPMEDGAQTVKDIKPSTIPDNVLMAFNKLREGTLSKAQIARDLDTSTRSLDRWTEKYDYESWKKTMDASVQSDALTETPENLEAAGEMFDKLHAEAEAGRKATPPVALEDKKPVSKRDTIRRMFESAKTKDDYQAIVSFKKQSKKGWADLGITGVEEQIITRGLSMPSNTFDVYLITTNKVIEAIKVVRELFGLGLKEAKTIVDSGRVLTDGTSKAAALMTKTMNDVGIVTETVIHGKPRTEVKKVEVKSTVTTPTAALSKAQQARLLFEQKKWKELHDFKKAAKKGWDVLGFKDTEIGQITSHKA